MVGAELGPIHADRLDLIIELDVPLELKQRKVFVCHNLLNSHPVCRWFPVNCLYIMRSHQHGKRTRRTCLAICSITHPV